MKWKTVGALLVLASVLMLVLGCDDEDEGTSQTYDDGNNSMNNNNITDEPFPECGDGRCERWTASMWRTGAVCKVAYIEDSESCPSDCTPWCEYLAEWLIRYREQGCEFHDEELEGYIRGDLSMTWWEVQTNVCILDSESCDMDFPKKVERLDENGRYRLMSCLSCLSYNAQRYPNTCDMDCETDEGGSCKEYVWEEISSTEVGDGTGQ